MTDHATVDVVVVTFNGEASVEALIASLQASEGVTCRAIVVDNASTDRTVDLALGLGVEVVRSQDNVGYGAGFNRGLALTSAEWVICSNQDIVVEPGAIRTLVDAVAARPGGSGAGCLAGPSLRDTDGRLLETFYKLPTLGRQLAEVLGGEGLAGPRSQHPVAGVNECGWMSAAFVLGRRSTFERLGGFDPVYFMYCEDVDLFTRLHERGGCGLWVPDAVVTHTGGVRASVAPALVAHAAWGWGRYFGRRHGEAVARLVYVAQLVASVARMAVWGGRALGGAPEARQGARWFLEVARWQVRTVATGRRPPLP